MEKKAFYGNFGIVKAFTYLLMMGGNGLQEVSAKLYSMLII